MTLTFLYLYVTQVWPFLVLYDIYKLANYHLQFILIRNRLKSKSWMQPWENQSPKKRATNHANKEWHAHSSLKQHFQKTESTNNISET